MVLYQRIGMALRQSLMWVFVIVPFLPSEIIQCLCAFLTTQNFRDLGLCNDVNQGVDNIAEQARKRLIDDKVKLSGASIGEEKPGILTEILTMIQNAEPTPARVPTSMPVQEQQELVALRKRFGDDFEVSYGLMVSDTMPSIDLFWCREWPVTQNSMSGKRQLGNWRNDLPYLTLCKLYKFIVESKLVHLVNIYAFVVGIGLFCLFLAELIDGYSFAVLYCC